MNKLYLGDNMDSLKKLEDNSVDAVVTDPPYGLSFMNKKWDYSVPSVELWKEVYRVLKPGAHVLSFGGTRTYHRMVVNIEDAGFEIRDQIMWLYGSGFPKSYNIGKAVDKLQGNEREVVGIEKGAGSNKFTDGVNGLKPEYENTKGQSEWEGWGTALKPANEPICVARKPLSEKSVALNVLKWGTGGINIDGCRITTLSEDDIKQANKSPKKSDTENDSMFGVGRATGDFNELNSEGRFPANVIFECICDEVIKGEKGEVKKSGFRVGGKSENSVGLNGVKNAPDDYGDKGDIHTNPDCPCYMLDRQSGISKSRSKYPEPSLDNLPMNHYETTKIKHISGREQTKEFISDKGGSSRFFYNAKVSKKERNMGLDGFEDKKVAFRATKGGSSGEASKGMERFESMKKNPHPTVKPVALMAYLCRLITPPNGTILDPYMGSGSTGITAKLEGFDFIGMEMDKEYFDIAEARIENFELYREFLKK
jgi:DNA modification methylase